MLVLFLLPLLIIGLIQKVLTKKSNKNINQKHVVITGGSSGIGKSVAVLCARKGAHVTIIARNVERLAEAKIEIENSCINKNQIITTVSVDVSNFNAVNKELNDIEEKVGPIYMLVNCAGMAICGKLEDFNERDISTLINANFLGTVYPTQCVVPKLKKQQEGIIVITASQVALMGMYGYSIYSSCKFALRGLAESLSQELKPYNISVTLSLPPDTNTPGFENENKTKPEETKLISESGSIFQPEVVAEKLLDDALGGKFFSFVGFESYILTNLCVGMSPFSNFLELIVQSLLLGPLRLLGAYYIKSFDTIIKNCHLSKVKNN